MNPWFLLGLGLALGVGVGWLATRAHLQGRFQEQLRQAESCAAAAGATAAAARERYEKAEEQTEALSQKLEAEQKGKAAADAALEAERRNAQEQRRLLEDAEERLTTAFKSISGDVLNDQSQAFLRLAGERFNTLRETAQDDLKARENAIAALLGPLNKSLEEYDTQVQEMEKARKQAYGGLENELRNLVVTNERLQTETGNLNNALRGGAQVRGRWGEMTLRRVAELSGMSAHCDFLEQEPLSSDEGLLRPDMIVNLAGGRRIAVDAKAPLLAFLDAAAAPTEEERRACLARHAQNVRKHLSQLALKAYWDQLDPAPDMVLLFLPGECFFSAALEQDRTLMEDGMKKRVVVATPTTLIALLRAVAYGWRQEQIAKNAQAVSDLGKQVYDRLRVFIGHFSEVGSSLRKAVQDYKGAAASLESRVLASARQFKDLGAATGDDIEEVAVIDEVPPALNLSEENDGASISSAPNKQATPNDTD